MALEITRSTPISTFRNPTDLTCRCSKHPGMGVSLAYRFTNAAQLTWSWRFATVDNDSPTLATMQPTPVSSPTACRAKIPTSGATSYPTASQPSTFLLQQPNIDASRLSISGGDLALITAALTDGVYALQSGGLMFADIDNRTAGNPDYPIAEFNDFKRSNPDDWDEARATLANYDPMALASGIDAGKVMLSAGASEKGYYDGLASALSPAKRLCVSILGRGTSTTSRKKIGSRMLAASKKDRRIIRGCHDVSFTATFR